MDRGNAVLQVRNLRTEFATRRGIVPAVDGVSFEVFEGKVTGLVGESGCGKSVTALSILGLVTSPPGRVARGEILFEGRDLARMTPREMGAFRGRDLSMIFQEPMTSLNPVKTVGNQVGEPLRVHLGLSAREARRRAEEMLDLVGIPEPQLRYGAFPHQLSGGQRQRVLLMLAL
ncbi:MAG TPA: ABC transporter ATP-binding protein, partial [Synergistaceae bacterium]|nr:ABC transporter ATP-binding protein [Synergistaceae bacterium]